MSEKNGKHVRQEPHGEADCRINDERHSHPDVDCEHTVHSGPGTKGGAGNLNNYCDDHGKHCLVGNPRHNLDQDVEHGPGVKK